MSDDHDRLVAAFGKLHREYETLKVQVDDWRDSCRHAADDRDEARAALKALVEATGAIAMRAWLAEGHQPAYDDWKSARAAAVALLGETP